MEELHVEQLLKEFKGFEVGERVILGHFGTVQTLLALIWDEPIYVELVGQYFTTELVRTVNLRAGDRIVCRAKSKIPNEGNHANVMLDIMGGKLGLGQILARHDLQTHRKLLSVGRDKDEFWRTYIIKGEYVFIEIHESFPRGIYKEIGWLNNDRIT